MAVDVFGGTHKETNMRAVRRVATEKRAGLAGGALSSPPNSEAQGIIAALRLEPLPEEGGWFRQTRATRAGSAIHFLITPDNFSALHRLRAEEIWHFHAGDPVEHVQLGIRGRVLRTRLGPDVLAGDTPQLVVPAGVWQGARIVAPATKGWALLGCTLAPPWNPRHFTLGERGTLLRLFPAQAAIVRALTR